VNGKGKREFV